MQNWKFAFKITFDVHSKHSVVGKASTFAHSIRVQHVKAPLTRAKRFPSKSKHSKYASKQLNGSTRLEVKLMLETNEHFDHTTYEKPLKCAQTKDLIMKIIFCFESFRGNLHAIGCSREAKPAQLSKTLQEK
jgi:hypothetical protein